MAYLKAEKGLHLMPVIKHRTIGHTLVTISKMLQVLVVGGDDGISPLFDEVFEHGFRQSASNVGLCARTKLVNEKQGMGIALLHHLLHAH